MLIKNGFMVNPASQEAKKTDIRIINGKIAEIGQLTEQPQEEQLDISGKVIAPGLIDTHVHFRDPGFTYKEDIHSGSLAAAKGGFTSVVCMANTSPVVDSVETLKDIQSRASKELIHIYQAAAVTKGFQGMELTPMEALKEAGACGFTDDGIPITNGTLCLDAMKKAAELNLPISLHEEDPSFILENGIHHGEASAFLGIYGSPSIAEESMVAKDCMRAILSKAHVVIQHISSAVSVDMVRTAKALGANIHAEATPHHFTLTEEAVKKHGALAKMNPPLRTEKDRLAIIYGLKDGTIDLIATDHAPHSSEEKAVLPIYKAPSGIIGLETSLSLGITSLVKTGHLTLLELLKKMTCNPAELYHLPGGNIQIGAPADLVIFDEEETWIPTDYCSKSSNTPFTGMRLYGKIYYTISDGKIIYSAASSKRNY